MERIKLNIQRFVTSVGVEFNAKTDKLRTDIQKLKTTIDSLKTSLQASNIEYGTSTKNVEVLNQRNKILNDTYNAQEKLIKKLKQYSKLLNTEDAESAKQKEKLSGQINKVNDALTLTEARMSRNSRLMQEQTEKTETYKNAVTSLGEAFSGLNLSFVINAIKRLGSALYTDYISKAVDTSEELNLFNVVFDNMQENGKKTFSELGKEAMNFQNKLNEAFGTNMKETMRYQGLFQAMGESAGLSDKTSALMSENMTKLAYDLASLYNTSETKAAESLRAGVYAGQTKPLRNYGIDVTQTSYKPLMQELGLEKSVNELTQAEKELLRYISTLKQARNAMGDFANTIESPANQLKVLKQQFYEMQAAIGNLFMGAFARMLPYVNGIIMAIKAVAQTIASFFGIELKDYNTGLAYHEDTLEDYAEGLDGIGSSAGGASKAIDKLKRQTLAFDQINNLTTPTPSSGSGGGGSGGSGGVLGAIDSRLLDAIKGYDNGMDKVRMKALDIRDKLMDILGFTRHIDAETGKTYFTYDGWKETVKGIWNWFKELTPLAKTFTAIGIAAGVLKLYQALKKIAQLTGIGPVVKSFVGLLKNAVTPLANLTTSMIKFSAISIQSTGNINGLNEGIKAGIKDWREQQGIIDSTTGKLNGLTGVLQGAKNVALGLGEAALGLGTLAKSVDNLTTNGANLGNVMGTAGGTIMAVFGGAQAGAVFGPWGAAIGAVAGAVASLVTVVLNANDALDLSIKSVNEATEENVKYFDSLKSVREENARLLDESLGMTNHHEKLLNELKSIVDENGRVKEGYEDRAKFIVGTLAEAYGLQMYYEDGIIHKYGEEIDSIQGLIDINKARIKFESYSEQYEENIKKETEALKTLDDQTLQLQTAEENLAEARKKYEEIRSKSTASDIQEDYYKYKLTKAEKSYAEAKDGTTIAFQEYFETLILNDKYERAYVANTEKNYDEVNRIIDESREESIESLKNTMIQQSQTVENLSGDIIEKWKALAAGSRDEYKDAIDQLPESVAGALQIMTGTITRVTPEVVSYFSNLGQVSEEELVLKLKELPDDIQRDVVDQMKAKGAKIPEEIQKGIDSKPDPRIATEVIIDSEGQIQHKVNENTKNVKGTVYLSADTSSFKKTIETTIGGMKYKVKTSDSGWVTITKAATGGIFANGKWQQIQGYANGGLPAGGQLFMAREAGPELVGKIGRHTAVMNNNQIVDSVKAGVYEAVSAAMSNGGMGAIELVAHTDEGVVIDRINRITRQTGECPIDI